MEVFCYKTHLHNARGNFHLFYFYGSVTVLLCNECNAWKAKIGDSSYSEYPRGYTKQETLLQTGSVKSAHRHSILLTCNAVFLIVKVSSWNILITSNEYFVDFILKTFFAPQQSLMIVLWQLKQICTWNSQL